MVYVYVHYQCSSIPVKVEWVAISLPLLIN